MPLCSTYLAPQQRADEQELNIYHEKNIFKKKPMWKQIFKKIIEAWICDGMSNAAQATICDWTSTVLPPPQASRLPWPGWLWTHTDKYSIVQRCWSVLLGRKSNFFLDIGCFSLIFSPFLVADKFQKNVFSSFFVCEGPKHWTMNHSSVKNN